MSKNKPPQPPSLISDAYMDTLSSMPNRMEDCVPQFTRQSPPISCLVWNVQGAGSREFASALKEVVRMHKPNVIALIETHMGGERAEQIAKILNFHGHFRMDASGFSGGIWVYLRPEDIVIDPIDYSDQCITMNLRRIEGEPWFFSVVYASTDPSKRRDLWSNLKDFAAQNNKPWLLAGDFNDTRFNWERSSACDETQRRSARFNEWVEDMELVELEFSAASHTWARGLSPKTHKSARLDRALYNGEWALKYSDAKVKHLPAIESDHCPLLISSNGFAPLDQINRPFRFQAAWLTHEGFEGFLNASWSKDEPLVPMLQKLARKLQEWNKATFHNIFREKRRFLARLEGIQKALTTHKHGGLIKLEAKLRRELDQVLLQEELLWYQKSRAEWIKDGDRNTTFFHLSTITRRWRNKISAIKNTEGDWVHEKEEVKKTVVMYFKDLFQEDGVVEDAYMSTDIFPEFSNAAWELLVRPFSMAEVEGAIMEMGSLKALGPDGFQALFYQKHWEIVKESVYKMVFDALEGRGLPTHLNDTYLSLIPKVENPEFTSQFRPIGL